MLTRIPFYKDVIISSFSCDHCNYKNSEIESANTVKEKGININLLVKNKADLNREIIKSDYATLEIPEVDFEIPAKTQKSCLFLLFLNLSSLNHVVLFLDFTTIEGVIDRTIENLRTEIQRNASY